MKLHWLLFDVVGAWQKLICRLFRHDYPTHYTPIEEDEFYVMREKTCRRCGHTHTWITWL